MRTRLGALVIAAGLPLLVSACGDDSASSDTLPPMITTTTTTTIPATTTTTVVSLYEVQSGDSLSAIAKKFGVDQAALMMVNGITDPDHIEAGSVLTIPPPTTAATSTSTSTGAATSTT